MWHICKVLKGYTESSRRSWVHKVCTISTLNSFMHIYNMSVTYLQSIKRIHWYSESSRRSWVHKVCTISTMEVQNAVNLSKIIFLALNSFMHIYNMSVTCLQSSKWMYWIYDKHLAVKITKWYNSLQYWSFNPQFSYITCNVWWLRCGENLNKIGQELLKLQSKTLITEWLKDHGITDRLKTVYPLKLRFAGVK